MILSMAGMSLSEAALANSSAISHFGLFAAIKGVVFVVQASLMIPIVVSMPFLAHTLVFGIFEKNADYNGVMPRKIV